MAEIKDEVIPKCRLDEKGNYVCKVRYFDDHGRPWEGKVIVRKSSGGRWIVVDTSEGELPTKGINKLLDFLEENSIEGM